MSDSLRPHGLMPTRLLCPCDFPGKNTGVGHHFLLQGIFLTQARIEPILLDSRAFPSTCFCFVGLSLLVSLCESVFDCVHLCCLKPREDEPYVRLLRVLVVLSPSQTTYASILKVLLIFEAFFSLLSLSSLSGAPIS